MFYGTSYHAKRRGAKGKSVWETFGHLALVNPNPSEFAQWLGLGSLWLHRCGWWGRNSIRQGLIAVIRHVICDDGMVIARRVGPLRPEQAGENYRSKTFDVKISQLGGG